MDFEESEATRESENEEPDVPKRRGRPPGVKNKAKETPPTDAVNALQDRIAFLEAASVKMKTKPPPRKREPIHLIGSPTNAGRQLCEILRRDGILPAAPPPTRDPSPEPYVDRARETQRQKREALYASFLS